MKKNGGHEHNVLWAHGKVTESTREWLAKALQEREYTEQLATQCQ